MKVPVKKIIHHEKGNKYLKSALIEAAHSIRGPNNYLDALYRRTAARKGKKRGGSRRSYHCRNQLLPIKHTKKCMWN